MAAYLFEPPAAPASAPSYYVDYSSTYSNIASYLNQVREELADIDTDTTASAATLLLIATSLATIATNTTTMATNSTTLATNTTTIANKQTAMESHQAKVRELAEGSGIHFIGPYEKFGLVSIYRMMIEQAKILETTGTAATSEQVTQALVEVRRISDLIRDNIPREF